MLYADEYGDLDTGRRIMDKGYDVIWGSGDVEENGIYLGGKQVVGSGALRDLGFKWGSADVAGFSPGQLARVHEQADRR